MHTSAVYTRDYSSELQRAASIKDKVRLCIARVTKGWARTAPTGMR